MPIEVLDATEMKRDRYLRSLCMAWPKHGKTVTTLRTAPGRKFVINSDQPGALEPALPYTQDFVSAYVKTIQELAEAIDWAFDAVQAGDIQTVVWDTVTGFSDDLSAQCLQWSRSTNRSHEEDGRKAWPKYHDTLSQSTGRLLRLEAHVIILSHYIDTRSDDGSVDNKGHKIPKIGEGIVPGLFGQSRATYAKHFNEVFVLEKRPSPAGDVRYFNFSPSGVWQTGCRNLPGVTEMPADFGALIKRIHAADPRLLDNWSKAPSIPRAAAPAQAAPAVQRTQTTPAVANPGRRVRNWRDE